MVRFLIKPLLFKKLFNGHDVIDYFNEVAAALKRISPKEIIYAAAAEVAHDDGPTIFCMIAEVLLSDNVLESNEKEILEHLAIALDIPEGLAMKIIDVMMIRNKGNNSYID